MTQWTMYNVQWHQPHLQLRLPDPMPSTWQLLTLIYNKNGGNADIGASVAPFKITIAQSTRRT